MIPLTPKQIAAFQAFARENSGDVHVHITVKASDVTPEQTAEFIRKHGLAIEKVIRRGVSR
jgi:uncharacterized protein (DUF849 family)